MSTMVRNVIAGLAALAGSVTTAFGSPLTIDDLKGTWTLVEIRSRPVPPTPVLPVFTIKDRSIEGFDGCNSFQGRLDQPGSIVSTRRGCPDGAVKLPLDLRDPMSRLKEGTIDNGRLILPARADLPEAIFRRSD